MPRRSISKRQAKQLGICCRCGERTGGKRAYCDQHRPSKYRAKKTFAEGLKFDSRHEAEVWGALRSLEKLGLIRNLQRQVPVKLVVNGHHIGDMKVDFHFEELRTETGSWIEVWADAKSERTRRLPEWRMKSKLFTAIHGKIIREVL